MVGILKNTHKEFSGRFYSNHQHTDSTGNLLGCSSCIPCGQNCHDSQYHYGPYGHSLPSLEMSKPLREREEKRGMCPFDQTSHKHHLISWHVCKDGGRELLLFVCSDLRAIGLGFPSD